MADYNKLKVTDLKEELKKRNIPLTGLKLKQQFVDKLIESDASSKPVPKDGPSKEPSNPPAEAPTEDLRGGQDHAPVLEGSESGGAVAATHDGAPLPSGPVQAQNPPEKSVDTEESIKEPPAPPIIPRSIEKPAEDAAPARTPSMASPHRSDLAANDTATPSLDQQEMVEDTRKRKRRSITPPPNSAEVAQKRARASNGSPVAVKFSHSDDEGQESASMKPPIQEKGLQAGSETHSAAADSIAEPLKDDSSVTGREESPQPSQDAQDAEMGNGDHMPATNSTKRASGPDARFKDLIRDGVDHASPPKETMKDDDRVIEPAVHPATSCLYIRNLKRPIRLPDLMSHLRLLADPPRLSPDPDIVKSLYVDSIKTHAFVTFSNVSAASRVRSAFHDTRWPEERIREPLWVDFIPDEKVERWIKQEEDGGDGRMVRWEVVYDEGEGGIEATLQKVGAPRKPSMPVHRSAEHVQDEVHPGRAGMIHPDRAGLVPREDPTRASRAPPRATGGSGGSGFQALDDLFSSTTAKPKLYFKPVPDDLMAARKGRLRDLLPVAEMRGRGADQEMRRYSFEDGDLWVDKGPEFGYGSRGGGGGGGGGYRRGRGGRGGPYRGRGGLSYEDSWRGRGR